MSIEDVSAHKAPQTGFDEPRSDAARLEDLYRDHKGDLVRRLRGIYGNGPPDPEDLAQIAFTKALAQQELGGIANPMGYLFRIAVNAGLDATRRQRTVNRFAQAEAVYAREDYVEQTTPSSVYESKENLELLTKALHQLPKHQRELVVRSRLRGETYVEIARDTGWSKAKISRELNSALKTLMQATNR